MPEGPSDEERDLSAALAWVGDVVGPLASVQPLQGGWTSTMLALTSRAGEELVLRLMTREPWRTHGEELTTRESRVQRMLSTTAVPAPLTRALDAAGLACGVPAHLMTRLPGRVGGVEIEGGRFDSTSLDRLATLLVTIHAVVPAIDVRSYQSWAWEAKLEVPTWARDPQVWRDAFAVLQTDAPAFEPCFIHRDFQLRNVLWLDGAVSGVVDWVETSLGPAWLDVAHCCTNLAITHGEEAADAFAAAYVERTGRTPQPYFDVMDVVGFLPAPGGDGFFAPVGEENRRLERRLARVLRRHRG